MEKIDRDGKRADGSKSDQVAATSPATRWRFIHLYKAHGFIFIPKLYFIIFYGNESDLYYVG